MTTDFRALCAELADELDAATGYTRKMDGKRITHPDVARARAALAEPESIEDRIAKADAAIEASMERVRKIAAPARAALAEGDEPAVPECREPASVTTEPSDEELRELMDKEFRSDAAALVRMAADKRQESTGVMRNVLNYHIAQYARAVLAHWATPNLEEVGRSLGDAPAPAAGEVGELVEWLHAKGREGLESGLKFAQENGRQLTRAAALLEQLSAQAQAPVPVASDVYFEFVVSDADYCTQAGGIAPTYAQALDEGQHYLAQYQQDGGHTLELRRVEVLPLPSGEVE